MSDQNAAKHELSITRFIDASPETVYKVWTERAPANGGRRAPTPRRWSISSFAPADAPTR
jgi:hypothetical protein